MYYLIILVLVLLQRMMGLGSVVLLHKPVASKISGKVFHYSISSEFQIVN